ncbi:hypothetical protein AALA79_20925 [Lachnospiraceae bacterium 64-25]
MDITWKSMLKNLIAILSLCIGIFAKRGIESVKFGFPVGYGKNYRT